MADEERKPGDPALVMEEYQAGTSFKSALGDRGMYDQNKINERFYVGDQWYGANAGSDRPLVRHNVIKRIGDYKMAVVGSSPVTVSYSAEGIPNTIGTQERIQPIREQLSAGQADAENLGLDENDEINLVMSAMSDYFRVTAERVKFDDIKEQALRNAYISGTGIVYTWWDDRIKTGLYADESRKTPITGDIACEVLDVENVYFGDPNVDDVQRQPYILITQRKNVSEIVREAKMNGQSSIVDQIAADNDTAYQAGDRSEKEADDAQKAILITKLWKEWADDGKSYTIKAVKVCNSLTIRPEWDMQVRLYPLAKFSWERRRSCAYGESEITYLIPNQIAINRMITASVWAVMVMGMPIMVVNQDIVQAPVTNDPGQIVPVLGDADAVNAIRYVNPPQFSQKFDQNIDSLIANTLTQSGANDAALGDIRPDNTSAIIAVREAATMPMQMVQNRYYSFIEDISRIWAEFWLVMYGKRALKVEDETGTWYMPFDGDRYKDLLISTRIDVGASSLWSEVQSIRTLDNLFDRQVIDVVQYLTRLPKGTVPNVNGIIRDLQNVNQAVSAATGAAANAASAASITAPNVQTPDEMMSGLSPDVQASLNSMPELVKSTLYKNVAGAQANNPVNMPAGNVL